MGGDAGGGGLYVVSGPGTAVTLTDSAVQTNAVISGKGGNGGASGKGGNGGAGGAGNGKFQAGGAGGNGADAPHNGPGNLLSRSVTTGMAGAGGEGGNALGGGIYVGTGNISVGLAPRSCPRTR